MRPAVAFLRRRRRWCRLVARPRGPASPAGEASVLLYTRAVLLGVSLCVLTAAAPRLQAVTPEYHLKAAFVARFPQFVEWPSAVWEGRAALDLCVVLPNRFGTALDEQVRGETVHGRPLVLREVSPNDPFDACHLLFVSAQPREGTERRVLAHTATRPILTVGESESFLDHGGVIVLRVVERRVRFEVDAPAAALAGLHLSSQLLRLAQRVRGGPS